MVAEAWFVKMGNQVSSNLKHALLLETSSGKRKQQQHSSTIKNNDKVTIDILSFEVANVMSKTVHLHKSLSDSEISRLRNEILTSEAVRSLVSSDHSYLLDLALAEKLDELNRVAGVVSRLGKKCSVPALQGFEHVYGDIVSGVIDVNELGFLVKHMEGMVRKMDRYVSNTKNLYSEMEVLNQLEQAMNKFQNNQNEESRRVFEQKLAWQRQDVRHLKEISLWNQTFDKVVELLARTVCTIYARMSVVFGDSALRKNSIGLAGGSPPPECGLVSGQISVPMKSEKLNRNHSGRSGSHSGSIGRTVERKMRRGDLAYLQPEDFVLPCGTSPGRLFMECLSLSSSVSKFDDDDDHSIGLGNNVKKKEQSCHSSGFDHAQISIPFNGDLRAKSGVQSCSTFGPKSRLGCALALHYANVIIVLEKLLSYPHLVGEEARDDLYQMLPTSLRLSLKAKLKSYVKNLAIYDAPLAHDWKVTLDGILRGLAPLAHNMIRWQSERNFEQHQIVSRTNVLLLQTLYFADKEKTEEAICEILIGLNYICRYEHQQNALLDCASSFDFEDCLEWQLQCGSSLLN
ncbi:hypothetical protein Ahy_B09g098111 isoform A [Arachis hypogaea]|uniref:DUF668 domain-containing protein n=1 Tax=Arachis hypogaea TaxID=3818 RepID=A0A444XQJ7_ARAHY|nr:hypothetical protein Ahy_B09g098111 isoform A [Arachis hypogaea]